MKLIIHSKSLMKVIVTFMMIRHCTAIMRRGVSSVTIRNIKNNKNWMKSVGISSSDDSMGGRSSDRPAMAASSLNYEGSAAWSGNGITRGFSSSSGSRINTSTNNGSSKNGGTSSGSSSNNNGRTALHAKQGGSTTTAAAPVETETTTTLSPTEKARSLEGGRVVVKNHYKTLTSTFLCGAPAVVIITNPFISRSPNSLCINIRFMTIPSLPGRLQINCYYPPFAKNMYPSPTSISNPCPSPPTHTCTYTSHHQVVRSPPPDKLIFRFTDEDEFKHKLAAAR